MNGEVLCAPEPGRQQQRRLPVPGRGHRDRPAARCTRFERHRRQRPSRSSRCAADGRHHQRHRAQALRPRRRAARHERHGDQPRGRDLHRALGIPPRASTRSRSAPSRTRRSRSRPPGNYAASAVTTDQGAPTDGGALPYPPKWRYFIANPTLALSARRRRRPTASSAAGSPRRRHPVRLHDAAPAALDNIAARSAVGRRLVDEPAHPDHGRQQRQHPRGLGRPAEPRAVPARPRSPRPASTPTPFTDAWNNSGCDPTQPGTRAATTSTPSVTNLFVLAQPDARLRPTTWASPRRTTTSRPTTSAAGAGRRPRDRQRPGGRARRRPRRRTSVATTPTRSPCRTAYPASPTSTSSSRSPARSTPRASTAPSTWASSATSTPTRSATG